MADNKEMEDKVEDVGGTASLEKKEIEENVEEAENIHDEEHEEGVTGGRTQAEKMFNDFINTVRSRQEDFSKAISDYTSNLEKPLADVIETENEIIIKTDLPGMEKKDINVNLTQDSVEILATFEEEFNEEEVDYIRRERNYGETRKVIQLPAKVKVKDVTAKFEDSILTINLPKVEAEKIEVDIN